VSDDNSLIEVKIGALIMDPNTNTPIVVLKGVESETVLPIWVGAFEANAIALEIEKIVPQRPMTHDLLRNVIIECGLVASRVIVTDLQENTFYAVVELRDNEGEIVSMDARPSDAIALALRLDCPIFVKQSVIDLSSSSNPLDPEPESSDPASGAEEWPDLIG
jgi:bifunctional DNase/RNase